MSTIKPQSLLRNVKTIRNFVRGFKSQPAKKSFKSTAGSAAFAISAGVAATATLMYNQDDLKLKLLPAVQASAYIPPAPERSFIMIKPDGVKRGLIADIIKRFEQRGYKLVALKLIHPDDVLLNMHYCDLRTKPFFTGLVAHVSSGPVVAMVWEGNDIVKQGRQMLGETDPRKSLPGSIRGDYSIDMGRNIIHGSDSVDSANAEIELWFSKEEIMEYDLPLHSQVFE